MNKKLIIVVACPDQGTGYDPEPLSLAFQDELHSLMHIVHSAQHVVNDLIYVLC